MQEIDGGDDWKQIYSETYYEDEDSGINGILYETFGGGPAGGYIERDDGTLLEWYQDWTKPKTYQNLTDKTLEFKIDELEFKYLRVVDSNPETLHNLVRYFKFCLFGTVWGHTAHATDPRTGIRL